MSFTIISDLLGQLVMFDRIIIFLMLGDQLLDLFGIQVIKQPISAYY